MSTFDSHLSQDRTVAGIAQEMIEWVVIAEGAVFPPLSDCSEQEVRFGTTDSQKGEVVTGCVTSDRFPKKICKRS